MLNFDFFLKKNWDQFLHHILCCLPPPKITSQNMPSEAKVKNILFHRKAMFHSPDVQVFVFLTIP